MNKPLFWPMWPTLLFCMWASAKPLFMRVAHIAHMAHIELRGAGYETQI